MASSKSRKKGANGKGAAAKGRSKPRSYYGGIVSGKRRRWDMIIIAVIVVAAVGWFAVDKFADVEAAAQFDNLVTEGQPVMERLETLRDDGRWHLAVGQTHVYRDNFPTSGPHSPVWTRPGFYDEPQGAINLVHALEHGNVVIYFDRLADKDREILREWIGLFNGQWDGLIATPRHGLGEQVVLTAWTKRLRLDAFDPAAAAAFIDAYRGRGPEFPVR